MDSNCDLMINFKATSIDGLFFEAQSTTTNLVWNDMTGEVKLYFKDAEFSMGSVKLQIAPRKNLTSSVELVISSCEGSKEMLHKSQFMVKGMSITPRGYLVPF